MRIAMRPNLLDPFFASITSLPASARRWRSCIAGCSAATTCRASSICCFHLPTGAIDRRARPKLRDVEPGSGGDGEGDGGPPPPRRRPAAIACRISIYASDETGDIVLTYFRPRKDYLEKLFPVGETRYVSGTTAFYDGMLQMVHPDRVVDEKGLAALPADRAGLSADRRPL